MKTEIVTNFIKRISSFLALKRIYANYMELKRQKIMIFRRNFVVTLMAIKLRVKFTKFGKDRDLRHLRTAKKLLTFCGSAIKKDT